MNENEKRKDKNKVNEAHIKKPEIDTKNKKEKNFFHTNNFFIILLIIFLPLLYIYNSFFSSDIKKIMTNNIFYNKEYYIEKNKLKEEKDKLQEENNQLKKEKDKIQKKYNQLKKEKDILKKEKDKSKKEEVKFKKEEVKLKKEKDKLIKEKDKLKKEKDKLKKEKDEIKKEKDELKKEKDEIKKEKDKLKTGEVKLKKEKDKIKKEKDELIKEKNEIKKEKNKLKIEEDKTNEKLIPMHQDVYKIEKFSSRKKSFQKAKSFLEKCINGTISQKIPLAPIENPIASAIIPLYNGKQYISRAIKSIQNQNIMNIEIIIVDDKSTDDPLSVLKEIQKKEPRLKIIENQKNMGTLYSRCIGALSAKGKYIFPLDSDDMFLDEDVFSTIINIAEKGYFDIVEFKGIRLHKGEKDIFNNKMTDTKWGNHPLNLVLYQPALGNYATWPSRNINYLHLESGYLWAKCIRTEIYKKTIYKLGEEKYSRQMKRYEDIVMIYALFNMARTYKFVGKYGILYIYTPGSVTTNKIKAETDIYSVYYLDIMIDFVQDRVENKKVLVNTIMNLFRRKSSFKKALKTNKKIYELFISCLDKVLNMTKISDELKNEIRKKGKTLKFINYNF